MSDIIAKGSKPSDFTYKDRSQVEDDNFHMQQVAVTYIYVVETTLKDNKLFRLGYFWEKEARDKAREIAGYINPGSEANKYLHVTRFAPNSEITISKVSVLSRCELRDEWSLLEDKTPVLTPMEEQEIGMEK